METYCSAKEVSGPRPCRTPGCLVLDVELPGLSGLEFQRELSRTDVHIPIVFLTGHGDIPMSVRAIKAGAFEFLTKPFDPEDLLDAIQEGMLTREYTGSPRAIPRCTRMKSSAPAMPTGRCGSGSKWSHRPIRPC